MTNIQVHRGEILHLLDDPTTNPIGATEYFPDGVLLVKDGKVAACGPADDILQTLPADVEVTLHHDALIAPGLVDTHIHFPQTGVIASWGSQLLEWLETYTFPAEKQFADDLFATEQSQIFLDELIRNGTTTAMVFASVHKASVNAFFTEARKRKLRMVCGKVMMDRNAPADLCDTAESSWFDSRKLIQQWHEQDRLSYAVTPRFAPTSSPEQLQKAGELLSEYPTVHMQTHLSENTKECDWVRSLFPQRKNYLDVYDHYGLLGRRSVFAHGIHLSDSEWQRMHDTASSVSHCPCSNLFIGSGLFDYAAARNHEVTVALGSDVGGGDSFSLFRSLNEAYKVQQLKGMNLSPLELFYLATLGGARALDFEKQIGNFLPGKEADFIVLDYKATPLIEHRIGLSRTLEEKLFALIMLGDDRVVRETRILGQEQKRQLPI